MCIFEKIKGWLFPRLDDEERNRILRILSDYEDDLSRLEEQYVTFSDRQAFVAKWSPKVEEIKAVRIPKRDAVKEPVQAFLGAYKGIDSIFSGMNEKFIQRESNEMIVEKNKFANKSRLLAGYCWDWISTGKNDTTVHDIVIGDFEMSWNLGNSSTWAIDEKSVNEIGCIHTSQGLEFDYVGVIIGEDLRYENGHVITDFTKRASTDQSLKGIKKKYSENPLEAYKLADEIIRNTYRTLMTRGMKGCYIFCVDKGLQEYFKERIENV